MNKLAFAVTLAALIGCVPAQDFMSRHPKTSAVIAGSLVTSLYLSTRSHSRGDDRRIGIEPVGCTPEKCQ